VGCPALRRDRRAQGRGADPGGEVVVLACAGIIAEASAALGLVDSSGMVPVMLEAHLEGSSAGKFPHDRSSEKPARRRIEEARGHPGPA
jgi:hypothetical protein